MFLFLREHGGRATYANELLRNCVAAKQSTNRAFDQYANTLQAVASLGKCEISEYPVAFF